MIGRIAAAAMLGALALAGTSMRSEDEATPEPEHYRNEDYRAPRPRPCGARGWSREELWRAGTAAFVELSPHAPRPDNLPAGTLWRDGRGSTFRAARGSPIRGTASSRRAQRAISGQVWSRLRVGNMANHGDLLPTRLLDVVERGQASDLAGLYCCRVVSRRHRWLARSWPSAQRS